MRICMVAYSNYENDNRIMRYADSLTRAGHQVDAGVYFTKLIVGGQSSVKKMMLLK